MATNSFSWSCALCTFSNNATLSHCEMCTTAKTEQPIYSIQTDYELAKRLQEQYLEVDQKAPSNPSNHHQIPSTNSNSLQRSPETPQSVTIVRRDRGITTTTSIPSDNASSDDNSEPSMTIQRIQNRISNRRNTNSSQSNQRNVNQKNRKRKRKQMEREMEIDEDEDSDYDDPNSNRIQFKIKEESVIYHWGSPDILARIGTKWVPGHSKWMNPVLNGDITLSSSGLDRIESGGNPIESIVAFDHRVNPFGIDGERYTNRGCAFICDDTRDLPYVIIDFKDIKVQLKEYKMEHGFADIYDWQKDMAVEWVIEASKDSQVWTLIHQTHSSPMYENRSKHHRIEDYKIGYFSKFRIRLTGPNLSRRNILKIKHLRLFGDVRRKAYKLRERKDEVKSAMPFAKIPTKRCIGDPNKVMKILNDFEGIQHNDYKEYEEDIPHLNVELKDYQKRGLSWMIDMEENGTEDGIHGGLLCDEMGLGKTVQMIALMLVQREKKRKINKNAKDRTIIITPLSLIDQWISELSKIADKKTFKIINYYGSQRKKIKKTDFVQCDVVLSTTSTFSNVVGKLTKEWDDFEHKWWTKGTKQQLLFSLSDGFFSRIVIDESHEIKNTTSKRSEIICAFAAKCDYKWCLTGTPINNDLPSDLSGMCRYLGMSHEQYVNTFNLSVDERKEAQIVEKSRFDKNKTLWMDLDNEFCVNKIKTFFKSIMIRRTKEKVLHHDFPEKEEVIINVELNDEEKVIYEKISKQALNQYKEFKKHKSVMSHYMHLMRMLTKLRKLCNHPSMVFTVNINADIMDFALNSDVLEKLQPDIARRINEMESLLEYECPICFDLTEINGAIISKCGHMFCLECLNELIEAKPECGLCRTRFTKSNIVRITHVMKSKKLEQKHKDEFEEFKINGSNRDKSEDDEDDGNKYDELVKKYSEITMSTSKTKALMDRLKYIKEHHNGDKALVFSNFTNYLGIIATQLKNEKIKYLEFNSGLNRKKRKNILERFRSSKDCGVLLISAKCASVGLNLMCANHVIFVDPRCNPGLDDQAIARCWRIGQNKRVYVTRLITEGTIEEKILSLQQDKTEEKEENGTRLKRKAKLTEKDYDIIFDYKREEVIENVEPENNHNNGS